MMANHFTQPIFCKPIIESVSCSVLLLSLSEVVSQKDNPAILGGNDSVVGNSIFAAEPVEIFEFELRDDQPFEKLFAVLSKYCLDEKGTSAVSGFGCGWIGYFGYELGRFIEKLPCRAVDDLGFPVIRLAFYDKAIIYDHKSKQFHLIVLDYKGQTQSVEQKVSSLKNWLGQAKKTAFPLPLKIDIDTASMDAFTSNMTESQYIEAIRKTKYYIYDGETYQINFSQRFSTAFGGCAVDLFHWQNSFNPSPYAAYLAWGDRAVVSASPELFLDVDGDTVTTKPIKGTRPRNPGLPDDTGENDDQFHALVCSEKDQAELAMIVDLERNDLARVCVPGTRRVVCQREIEMFPTVYHAVGIVQGQLRTQPGPSRVIELLKATFPGGSITGAPKIRSMDIIDELEPTARGVYTGSIGWIGLDFNLCWNIAIRTILISGNEAHVQTGGGIVADSDPSAEWNETLVKARALVAGVQASSNINRTC
jgi:para-aminobenzoate synthetase component 1